MSKVQKKKIWYLDWFVRGLVLFPLFYLVLDFIHGFFLHKGWVVLLVKLFGGVPQ